MVLAQGTRGTWGVQTVFEALGWERMERGGWKGPGLLLLKPAGPPGVLAARCRQWALGC